MGKGIDILCYKMLHMQKIQSVLLKPKGHCQIYYFCVANYEMMHSKYLHSLSFKLGNIDRMGGLAEKATAIHGFNMRG